MQLDSVLVAWEAKHLEVAVAEVPCWTRGSASLAAVAVPQKVGQPLLPLQAISVATEVPFWQMPLWILDPRKATSLSLLTLMLEVDCLATAEALEGEAVQEAKVAKPISPRGSPLVFWRALGAPPTTAPQWRLAVLGPDLHAGVHPAT